MVNKHILFLAFVIVIFSLAFASAAYYGSRIFSFSDRSDIYWARDYYSSGAYHESKIYRDSRAQIQHHVQTLHNHQPTPHPRNYPYYYNQFYESYSIDSKAYHRPISSHYVYYSPTFNKYQLKNCYIVPPSNQLIYVRC